METTSKYTPEQQPERTRFRDFFSNIFGGEILVNKKTRPWYCYAVFLLVLGSILVVSEQKIHVKEKKIIELENTYKAEISRLKESGVSVRISDENAAMGLYKTFADEIFDRYEAALLAFDGNSAAMNLIQEAKNGRRKARIYLNTRSRDLAAKGSVLEGYVRPLREARREWEA